MARFFSQAKASVPKSIEKAFEQQRACYILLACTHPNNQGEMEVAMEYDGDPYLISYMLEEGVKKIDAALEKMN